HTHPPSPLTHPLSLHDALPISSEVVEPLRPLETREPVLAELAQRELVPDQRTRGLREDDLASVTGIPDPCGTVDVETDVSVGRRDRKSTRLNSSHQIISYAVVC